MGDDNSEYVDEVIRGLRLQIQATRYSIERVRAMERVLLSVSAMTPNAVWESLPLWRQMEYVHHLEQRCGDMWKTTWC